VCIVNIQFYFSCLFTTIKKTKSDIWYSESCINQALIIIIIIIIFQKQYSLEGVRVMVFNVTFNNISVILWLSFFLCTGYRLFNTFYLQIIHLYYTQ